MKIKDWDIFGKGQNKTLAFWTFKKDGSIDSKIPVDSEGWYHVKLKRRAIYRRSDMIFAFLFGAVAGVVGVVSYLIIF